MVPIVCIHISLSVCHPFPRKMAGMSIEEGNSKWFDFHKNGANRSCIICVRLCTHFFHLCATPSHAEAVGTSIEKGDSKWSNLHKNYAIICVRTFLYVCYPFPRKEGCHVY